MMWDFAFRNMWQRRLRALLTILGVAAALQLYLTMNNLIVTFEADMQRQYRAFAGKIYVEQSLPAGKGWQGFPSAASSIEGETAEAVLGLEGVDRAASSAAVFVPLVPSVIPNNPPYVLAAGIEPGREQALLGVTEAESGQLALAAEDTVILGHGAAAYYGAATDEEAVSSADTLYGGGAQGEPVGAGDAIEVLGRAFTVAGVLEPGSQFFDGLVLMDLAVAQDLFNRPGAVSAVILTASTVDGIAPLAAELEQRFPELNASSEEQLVENARQWVAVQNVFFGMINNTVVVVAIVVVTIVMVVAVMERRREIGILRAIGASRRSVFGLIVAESLTVCLLGALLSLPLSVVFAELLWDWTVGTAVITTWLPTVGVAAVVGVLASLLPAWQAVRVDPLEALRYE